MCAPNKNMTCTKLIIYKHLKLLQKHDFHQNVLNIIMVIINKNNNNTASFQASTKLTYPIISTNTLPDIIIILLKCKFIYSLYYYHVYASLVCCHVFRKVFLYKFVSERKRRGKRCKSLVTNYKYNQTTEEIW